MQLVHKPMNSDCNLLTELHIPVFLMELILNVEKFHKQYIRPVENTTYDSNNVYREKQYTPRHLSLAL